MPDFCHAELVFATNPVGVESSVHDERNRWSAIWRASGATKKGERQPQTENYGVPTIVDYEDVEL